MKIAKRIAIIICILFLLLGATLICTSIMNLHASKEWVKAPFPPGKMIDIGSHKLYTTIKGTGTPTIIIETGPGASSAEWWEIQNELSKYTRVITYDRAGYGWSEKSPKPRTSKQIILELDTLLAKTGIKGPYILVGQMSGAFYMQHFARTHSKDIVGIILIEPIRLDSESFQKIVNINMKSIYSGLRIFAQAGLIRSLKIIPHINKIPKKTKNLIIEQYSQKKTYDALISESDNINTSCIDQIEKSGQFPQVPLTVIYHSPDLTKNIFLSFGFPYDDIDLFETVWEEEIYKTAKLSPKGNVICATKSTYNVHLDEPELIIKEIKKMIK